MNVVNNVDMNLEIIENGILMEDVDTTKKRVVKVHIPKIMPYTESKKAIDVPCSLALAIIANDPETFPAVNPMIIKSNYINIPLATNVYLDTKMYKGKHLDIYINNKNIKRMMVISMGGDELD